MKIPVYDPQINASTTQYNAVADIRTNTLGEIADGLEQYGKFREAQLEEERKTEQFKADSAIRYELDDAHSKMLDSIQNGGSYADAEAKYQKTFDETIAKHMPAMGDDPNVTERFQAEYKRYGLGQLIQLRNTIQARRKSDAIDATNLRVQQSEERMMRAMIAGDEKGINDEILKQSSIYAGATSVGALSQDDAKLKIQQRISSMRSEQAQYLANKDPRLAKQALENAYAKKEIMAEDYIKSSIFVDKAIEEVGSYESVINFANDPVNNVRPSKKSIDVGFNYVLQKTKDMSPAAYENEVINYAVTAKGAPSQILNQAGVYFSSEADTADVGSVMQMARITSEISKRDQTFLDGTRFDKNDIAIANLMVDRVEAGMTEAEAVKSVLRQKNSKNASDLFESAQNSIVLDIRDGNVEVSPINQSDYIDAYSVSIMNGASKKEAKKYADQVIGKTYGKFNNVDVKNPATMIPDPTNLGAVYSEKEWNSAVDELIGNEWIKERFGAESKPLVMADRETLRLVSLGRQPTFPIAVHLGGDNPLNFMIPRDSNGKPIRLRMTKSAKSQYDAEAEAAYRIFPTTVKPKGQD